MSAQEICRLFFLSTSTNGVVDCEHFASCFSAARQGVSQLGDSFFPINSRFFSIIKNLLNVDLLLSTKFSTFVRDQTGASEQFFPSRPSPVVDFKMSEHWCLRLPGAGSGSNRRGNGLPMAAEFAGRCDFLLLFRCGADNLPGNPQCAKMSRLYP